MPRTQQTGPDIGGGGLQGSAGRIPVEMGYGLGAGLDDGHQSSGGLGLLGKVPNRHMLPFLISRKKTFKQSKNNILWKNLCFCFLTFGF